MSLNAEVPLEVFSLFEGLISLTKVVVLIMKLLLGLRNIHVGIFETVHLNVYIYHWEVLLKVLEEARDLCLETYGNNINVLLAC